MQRKPISACDSLQRSTEHTVTTILSEPGSSKEILTDDSAHATL